MLRRLSPSLIVSFALVTAMGIARADEPTPEATEPAAEKAAPEAETPDDDGVNDAASPRQRGGTPLSDDDAPKKLQKVKTADPVLPPPECKVDDDCKLGSICVEESCRPVRKQRRWVPPFYWHDPGPRSGYRDVPPFYFHHWSATREDTHSTTVVPLLLYSHHKTPTKIDDNIWPIFWHTKYLENGNKVGSKTALLPLFWWQNRKGRTVGALPLLFTGWQRDPERDLTEGMAGLIGYYRREHKNTWRVLFPLYWDHEQQGGRLATIFPLFWYHRDGLSSQGVFFPLLWRWKNDETGTENLTFLPLFNLQRQRFGRRSIVLTLLGGYEHDVDAGRSQLLLLAPPFYHRKDPNLDLDVLIPIFGRWDSHKTGSHGFYAGPIVHVGDNEGSTTTVFPLYWRFFDRRTGRDTHLLFPLGGYHSAPGYRAAAVGPVYGWKSERERGGWGGGLAPILMFGRSQGTRHAMLLPLFSWWRDDDTGKQLTAVGPIFVRNNPPKHGFDAGILPLLFFGHEDGRGYGYLAPIFWYRKTPERTTAVVGPAYYTKTATSWSGGLAPLLFFGKRGPSSYGMLLPLVYHASGPEKSTTWVLPYLHDRDHEKTTDAFFPLFYAKRSPEKTVIATPIGGYEREGTRAFGLIGPYIYKADRARQTSTHVLFPLAFVTRSPSYDLTAVLPVFWQVRNGPTRDTLLFPLFWHRRGGQTDLDVLFPLFLRSRTAHATTFVVGPYFGRRPNDGHGWRQDGILGLFSYGEKHEGDKLSRFVGGPGFFYQRNDFTGVKRFLLGPFFDWRRPDGYTSGLFPAIFAARRGAQTWAVTPFFYHQADRSRGFRLDVLGPIYWGKSGGAIHVGLAPIFFGKYGSDGTSKTILFPLLYFAKKTIGSTLVTPIGGYSSYDGGWKTLIGPIYARRDRLTASEALFPIFYHGRNRVTGSTTTLVFPFYFDRDDKLDGVRVQAFTPLFWRYRSIEQTTTIALPFLAFDVNYHAESRTTVAFPLFIRRRSAASESTWWTVPPLLMWGRDRHGENPGKDFVFFPLLWRFGGKDRSTTVLFPLVWDFKRGENRTTFFLLGAHWKRPDGDRTLVLNTFFRKGKNHEAGSWWFEFWPLVNFGRPRAHDLEWNALYGLVGYSRQGRNRTLRLFWFIPITLQPVPRSNLSWWSSTPPEQRTEF